MAAVARAGVATTLPQTAVAFTNIVPPLLLIFLLAVLWPRRGPAGEGHAADDGIARTAAAIAALQVQLTAAESTLAAIASHGDQLAGGVTGAQLAATTALIEDAAAAAYAATDGMLTAMPELARHAGDVETALHRAGTGSHEQVQAVDALLAGVRARHDEAASAADASIAAMTALLGRIDAASKQSTTAVAHRAYALDAAVDGVLERVAAAVETLHARIAAQALSIESGAAAAVARLETVVGTAATAIQDIDGAAGQAYSAAHAASEQLTRQLAELRSSIDAIEARAGEIDARHTRRDRDSLSVVSVRLIEKLNAGAIDMAGLLAISAGDTAWSSYLNGDRSVFTRAIVGQIDRDAARKVGRLYKHDAEFHAHASRYLDTFETLIRRLLEDRDGDAFAPAILSSDIGKLYVVLAHATERLPPVAG